MVRQAAIIGTGAIAGAHVKALADAGERVSLVAVVDVNAERAKAFGQEHNIPHVYSDTREMLDKHSPDLVHICTPPGTHASLITQCLEAGASVLCEKPLCLSLAEFDQIQAAEERSGQYVSTVFQWRFGSAAQHVKGLMNAGEMGRPLVAVCQTLWYRALPYYQVPWRGKWSTEGGGPTVSLGIHLMDLLLWLMGDWAEVRAMIGHLDRPIEVEDISMALVRLENGAVGNITNSALSPRQESYLRLDFQRATVEVSALYRYTNTNWQFSLFDGSTEQEALARWQAIEQDVSGTHSVQLAWLLDSLDRKERPFVSGKESRRIIEFIASLYKSAASGLPVSRGSIGPGDPFYYSMSGQPVSVKSS